MTFRMTTNVDDLDIVVSEFHRVPTSDCYIDTWNLGLLVDGADDGHAFILQFEVPICVIIMMVGVQNMSQFPSSSLQLFFVCLSTWSINSGSVPSRRVMQKVAVVVA